MTKHLRFSLIALLLLAVPGAKADFVADGLHYNLNSDGTATVIANSDYKNMASVIVPASVTAAGKDYRVTSLADSCFLDCEMLTSINIANSVTTLGNNCFRFCSNLTSVGLPSSLTKVGNYCFAYCSKLPSIVLPNSVTELGTSCFSYCTGLSSITLSNSIKSLKYSCFYSCTSLKSIDIPSSVTKLGFWCFWGCTSLTSVNLPSSVTELGTSCFAGCTSLASIDIPGSVTQLGEECFKGCSGLASLTLQEGVNMVGYDCFRGCTSLASVNLPSSVTKLEEDCFKGCTSLNTVTCSATTPPTCGSTTRSAFTDEASKTLYVPSACVDAYKDAQGWKAFGNILPIVATGLNSVGSNGFMLTSQNGTVTLTGVPSEMPVSVYSINGALIGSGKGNMSINADRGQVVVVKAGSKSCKLLVK